MRRTVCTVQKCAVCSMQCVPLRCTKQVDPAPAPWVTPVANLGENTNGANVTVWQQWRHIYQDRRAASADAHMHKIQNCTNPQMQKIGFMPGSLLKFAVKKIYFMRTFGCSQKGPGEL